MSSAILPSPPPVLHDDYTGDSWPVIATNNLGMIVDENIGPVSKRRKPQQDVVVRKKSEPRRYVSRHFTQAKATMRGGIGKGKAKANGRMTERKKRVKVEDGDALDDDGVDVSEESVQSVLATPISSHGGQTSQPNPEQASSQPEEQPEPQPRIFYGLNVDDLSSDSDLTDVPSDIGPDPFEPSKVTAIKLLKKKSKPATKSHPSKSPYFPIPRHRHRQHFLSNLPFPPLDHKTFGLMQERLAHDPFRLLIATIFLNKTPGERAMPIFFSLMRKYPTPLALSQAQVADVTEMIRTLGFQNQRARKCVAMATAWVENPVTKGRRYRKPNYPCKGDGRDVKEGEPIDDEDPRVAWEISHLPGLGPYSHDSWRMFCRDELRGIASDWLGQDAEADFEPEWKRVLPLDKELRAWMTWMWLKEGWVWNKETGNRTKADEELLAIARDGGVVQEREGREHLVVKGFQHESEVDIVGVEKPAGDFLPG